MVKGFFPGNAPAVNSFALQAAADIGGEIYIDAPGIYDVSETLYLGDDTSLNFGAGVYLRRQEKEGEIGLCVVNKGAFTKTRNKNIRITGMNLITNDVQSTPCDEHTKTAILGFRAHLGFMYIENLVIRDFTVTDLNTKDYAIQISDFENVLIENVRIEGLKDGIHFGPGNGFTIRHGYFRTFDDPIALNGSDYSVSNPHLGWIENGLIEDCYDLDADSTTGFFVRMLSGSWTDWRSGMTVQQSDTVVRNHRLYRVVMPPDGREFISYDPPEHEQGIVTINGIRWAATQDELYTAGCRNITFRDIYLRKKRGCAFAFSMSDDAYLKSYYPGAPVPLQSNFLFDNINVQTEVENVIASNCPVDTVKLINSNLADSSLNFHKLNVEGLEYPTVKLILSNDTVSESSGALIKTGGTKVSLKMSGTVLDGNAAPFVEKGVEIISSDVELGKI